MENALSVDELHKWTSVTLYAAVKDDVTHAYIGQKPRYTPEVNDGVKHTKQAICGVGTPKAKALGGLLARRVIVADTNLAPLLEAPGFDTAEGYKKHRQKTFDDVVKTLELVQCKTCICEGARIISAWWKSEGWLDNSSDSINWTRMSLLTWQAENG